MSFKVKRKIAIAMLVATTAWPLVHHGLVRSFGLNPWKFFGWSMYAAPSFRVIGYPLSLADGRVLSSDGLTSEAKQRLVSVFHDFSSKRIEYGRLLPPDAFARALFTEYPEEEGIEIVLKRIGLDRKPSKIGELERFHYEYHRTDF